MRRDTSELKKRSGLELRAIADQRRQADPQQEAAHHEALFLKGIGSMQAEFDWLIENAAWTHLGFESVVGWWDSRVRPVMVQLEMRPAPEMVDKILTAVREAERALPATQRRTQRELASLTLASDWKLRGRQDHRNRRSAAESDLDKRPNETADGPLVPSDGGGRDTTSTPPAVGAGAPQEADRPAPTVNPEDHPAAPGEPPMPDEGRAIGDETEPGETPTDPGEVDREQEPSGVSAPAPTPPPPWLIRVSAVIAAVDELAKEDPAEVGQFIGEVFGHDLGATYDVFHDWYLRMQDATP
jgi:hypothetical protein